MCVNMWDVWGMAGRHRGNKDPRGSRGEVNGNIALRVIGCAVHQKDSNEALMKIDTIGIPEALGFK